MFKIPWNTNLTCEHQVKFIQERITSTEKNFAELCYILSAYARKAARLRDLGDEVAKVLEEYATSEQVNKSLAGGLSELSINFYSLGDYRDGFVQKLDTKVVGELSQYETICKNAKEEVKHTFSARDKEIARKRQLDRLKERNPRNRHQISQAESELIKATAEVSRTIRTLEELTNEFERRKLKDIKTILLDMVTLELGYHAKSLEVLTQAYHNINNVDEQADIEEFRRMLRMPETTSRLDTVRRTSFNTKRTQSLGSINAPFLTNAHKGTPSASPDIKPSTSKSVESIDSLKFSVSESITTVDGENDDESSEEEAKPIPARRRLFNAV